MPFFALRLLMAVASAAAILPAADVSFVARFANDSNRFQVGEVIPLELAYSADVPKKYEIETKIGGRNGPLGMESFDVTPPGRDPLLSYYEDPTQMFNLGGLENMLPLEQTPRTFHSNLNEWVTIERPGHYTLRVKSQRVSTNVEGQKLPPLLSNTLEFDVVKADPGWQQQTLFQAAFTLDNPTASEEERQKAADTIRYLDTPESIRELVRLLTTFKSPLEGDFSFGLIGARDRDLVVKELKARFTAPDAALTTEYIWVLGRMQFWGKHLSLARYPQNDASKQPAWQAERDKVYAESESINGELYRQAETALYSKQDAARAVTAATIEKQSREGKH